AALTVLVTLTQRLEQLGDMDILLELGCSLTACMKIAAFGQCDQFFNDRAQFLGLGQRGLDLLMLDQRASHIGEQRLAMFMSTVKSAIAAGVTHFISPLTSFYFVRRPMRAGH